MGLLACSIVATAQKSGGISTQMLQQMEKQHAANPANKALFNAIASNSIDDLSKNFKNQGPVDTHFSIETPKQSIHDQKQSGRCWMFSGLNVLRSNFAKLHNDTTGSRILTGLSFLLRPTGEGKPNVAGCIGQCP